MERTDIESPRKVIIPNTLLMIFEAGLLEDHMFQQVELHGVKTSNGERKQDADYFDEVSEEIINSYVPPDDYGDDELSTLFESERRDDTARSTLQTGDGADTTDRKGTVHFTEEVYDGEECVIILKEDIDAGRMG